MTATINAIALLLILNAADAQGLKKEYHQHVQRFISCIKHDNVSTLKTMVAYPLDRAYPLPDIKDETEFEEHYHTVFDDSLRKMIIESDIKTDWSSVGWRGIMLYNGLVWLDHSGRLVIVNYHSETERINRAQRIENEKKSLHKSIRNFKEPVLMMHTRSFKIRIDQLNNDTYRYVSWPKDANMRDTPALILNNGHIKLDGNGGNRHYVFTNGAYRYICYIHYLRDDYTPPARLVVYHKDEKIVNEAAQNIRR